MILTGEGMGHTEQYHWRICYNRKDYKNPCPKKYSHFIFLKSVGFHLTVFILKTKLLLYLCKFPLKKSNKFVG